ncbi:hypothetical protein JCM15519_32970 [Fundidesulfovibrio butyratiphilus]
MKGFAWAVLALMAACIGCAQDGSQTRGSTASRLQKLETSFESFQQDQLLAQKQRQARDSEIDAKLDQIATRLDSLTPGAKSAKAARPAKPVHSVQAGSTVPLVAGQVIPLSAFGTPPARPVAQASAPTPTPLAQTPTPLAQTPTPLAQAPQSVSPQPQPLTPNPSGRGPQTPAPAPVQLGQVQPLQAVQPQGQPAGSSLGLEPPVVTLPPQQQAPQAYAPQPLSAQAGKPVPYDRVVKSAPSVSRSRSGTSKSSPEAAPVVAATPSAPATPPVSAASAGKSDPVDAAQLYTDGMRAIAANKNDDGRRKMNELLTKYPNTDKAPLALYWVGESYMNERSYNQAILAFKDLTTRYPKSFKAPESVYKVAEAYERLGDKSNAIFHLKLLVDEYPGSELAGKAKQKLKQLGQ